MPLERAELFFRKGFARLQDGEVREAARHFLTAMQLEREHGVRRAEMRYLSFYGLSLALASGPSHAALRACEVAVDRDPENPDLRLNLARVHLLAGRHVRALRAALGGLAVDPAHPELRALVSATERRRRPAIALFHRDHAVNRVLGRLRASLAGKEKPLPRKRRGLRLASVVEASYQRNPSSTP
jgi:tetratricopeptide (TPR) repeat protein